MSDLIITHPSYFTLHKACTEWIVPHIKNLPREIDLILGLTRGGLFPAMILSHQMDDMHIVPVRYSSKTGKGDDRGHPNILPDLVPEPVSVEMEDPPTLLIVDDICDSGQTLWEVATHYRNRHHLVYTATLYYKQVRDGPIEPDIYWHAIPEDCGWILFPWEEDEPNSLELTLGS